MSRRRRHLAAVRKPLAAAPTWVKTPGSYTDPGNNIVEKNLSSLHSSLYLTKQLLTPQTKT